MIIFIQQQIKYISCHMGGKTLSYGWENVVIWVGKRCHIDPQTVLLSDTEPS